MWRRVAVVLLFVGFLSVPVQATLPAEQTLYFPFVTHRTLPLEVVVTARTEYPPWGYPTNYYVYGYVRNLSDRPVHGVVLELKETFYPYNPDGTDPPYSYPVRLSPALTATLPSQINPFAHSLLLGKASASFGQVFVVEGRVVGKDENRLVPLEVVAWDYLEGTLQGTVRNTSAHFLTGVRVVVTTEGRCPWRSATPETSRLQPGEETAFVAEYFGAGCLDQGVIVLGQGVIEPD